MSSICLYGSSALEYWRSERYAPLKSDILTRPLDADFKTPSIDDLQMLKRRRADFRTPVHVLVTKHTLRKTDNLTCAHVCEPGYDVGHILHVAQNVYACSPELCFLQMASSMDVYELVQLGCELCGTYAPPPRDMTALALREEPLTTAARLREFLESHPHARNRRVALRAAKLIWDNARSPMETVSAMLLSLPKKLGGMGLPRPELNYRVELDDEARNLVRKSFLVGDLVWPDAHVDVEYEGHAYHEGTDNLRADKSRVNALDHMGIDVMPLFDDHIRNESLLEIMTADIAGKLGFRLRERSYNESVPRNDLRRAILCQPGSAQPRWPGFREDAPLLEDALE